MERDVRSGTEDARDDDEARRRWQWVVAAAIKAQLELK
jgi:hypothetical protein